MSCPLDYSLCDKTVTLYRLKAGTVIRQVVEKAWYSWHTEQVTDAMGTKQETKFSLILPGQHTIFPGDRVYEGIGPVITAEKWPEFIPVCVPGLAQVQYVKPCYWQGQLCHTEAGRK